tara:strand:+ start:2715 stop:3002 length:288 start_codon:yes stop_codon:yes gene_type:complete
MKNTELIKKIITLDSLLADTPSMERFTLQCNSLETACREYLNKHLVFTHIGEMPADEKMRFDAFVIDFMDNNDCEELGTHGQIVKMAKDILRNIR